MNPMNTNTIDKDKISFEESIQMLQQKIEMLQKRNLPLDQALKTFQDAVEVSRVCNAKLDMAREEVKKIVVDANGDDYELETFEE